VSGFLNELGKKIAERWLTLLVLPGLLWVATALLATQLGWRHALDPHTAADGITGWANKSHSPGLIVLVLVGLFIASAAAGLTATALGALVRRLWMVRGRWRPARWLVRWRQHRWHTADNTVTSLVADAIRATTPPATDDTAATPAVVVTGPAVAEALARRDAISLEYPDRPTWISDRWRANTIRIHRAYGLDITVAWPRLWAVLPEPLRTDLATAQSSYTAASTQIGWAILYGILGVCWWPALLIGAATLTTGTLHARTATTTLCLLVETATDLHSHTLAEQLHIPSPGPFTTDLGNHINNLLRKDQPAGLQ
jgi:hypothetical protein